MADGKEDLIDAGKEYHGPSSLEFERQQGWIAPGETSGVPDGGWDFSGDGLWDGMQSIFNGISGFVGKDFMQIAKDWYDGEQSKKQIEEYNKIAREITDRYNALKLQWTDAAYGGKEARTEKGLDGQGVYHNDIIDDYIAHQKSIGEVVKQLKTPEDRKKFVEAVSKFADSQADRASEFMTSIMSDEDVVFGDKTIKSVGKARTDLISTLNQLLGDTAASINLADALGTGAINKADFTRAIDVGDALNTQAGDVSDQEYFRAMAVVAANEEKYDLLEAASKEAQLDIYNKLEAERYKGGFQGLSTRHTRDLAREFLANNTSLAKQLSDINISNAKIIGDAHVRRAKLEGEAAVKAAELEGDANVRGEERSRKSDMDQAEREGKAEIAGAENDIRNQDFITQLKDKAKFDGYRQEIYELDRPGMQDDALASGVLKTEEMMDPYLLGKVNYGSPDVAKQMMPKQFDLLGNILDKLMSPSGTPEDKKSGIEDLLKLGKEVVKGIGKDEPKVPAPAPTTPKTDTGGGGGGVVGVPTPGTTGTTGTGTTTPGTTGTTGPGSSNPDTGKTGDAGSAGGVDAGVTDETAKGLLDTMGIDTSGTKTPEHNPDPWDPSRKLEGGGDDMTNSVRPHDLGLTFNPVSQKTTDGEGGIATSTHGLVSSPEEEAASNSALLNGFSVEDGYTQSGGRLRQIDTDGDGIPDQFFEDGTSIDSWAFRQAKTDSEDLRQAGGYQLGDHDFNGKGLALNPEGGPGDYIEYETGNSGFEIDYQDGQGARAVGADEYNMFRQATAGASSGVEETAAVLTETYSGVDAGDGNAWRYSFYDTNQDGVYDVAYDENGNRYDDPDTLRNLEDQVVALGQAPTGFTNQKQGLHQRYQQPGEGNYQGTQYDAQGNVIKQMAQEQTVVFDPDTNTFAVVDMNGNVVEEGLTLEDMRAGGWTDELMGEALKEYEVATGDFQFNLTDISAAGENSWQGATQVDLGDLNEGSIQSGANVTGLGGGVHIPGGGASQALAGSGGAGALAGAVDVQGQGQGGQGGIDDTEAYYTDADGNVFLDHDSYQASLAGNSNLADFDFNLDTDFGNSDLFSGGLDTEFVLPWEQEA